MSKIKPIIKIKYVKKYLDGEISERKIAKLLRVSLASVQQWISNYKSLGEDAFTMIGNKRYSPQLKEAAVQDYLAGLGSQQNICQKYGIRSKSKLQNWIKKYNGHEELKYSGTGGFNIMTKGRKTTFEERAEIVEYCITHEHNYAETAEKYKISYQQARNYTIKYESNGRNSLEDRCGKRKSENEMNEIEKLRAENKILQAEKNVQKCKYLF